MTSTKFMLQLAEHDDSFITRLGRGMYTQAFSINNQYDGDDFN